MTLTWGTYRTQIRRSVLKDNLGTTWPDEVLRDLVWWALDTFCAHTAPATGVVYTGVTGTTLALPENLFTELESTGLAYLKSTSRTRAVQPASLFTDFESAEPSFSTWSGSLILSEKPAADETLVVRYFAYYNHPYADSDTIDIPAWGVPALSFLMGALAQTREATQSAGIDRFKDRKDSGTPVDNALIQLQNHYMCKYNDELARFPRQDRANFYRRLYR